jgi:hypothetical protein
MSTRIYTLPIDETQWRIPGQGATTVFNWDYDEGRDKLLQLYEKGKDKQWNATDRIDWSLDVDLDNPMGFPDEFIPIYGSRIWEDLPPKNRGEVRHHLESWRFSQFLHGEQGALICTAKIVQTVPDLDSKFYAATQVIDEARHVEVYKRYLLEKLEFAYPINEHLATLLNQGITDARWDMTYLAMQVIIEGLALAAFNLIRDMANDPLGRAINAYVMQDEARHVAFGRLALRDLYPNLSQQERDEREEFCVEALYLMRDRFQAEEVWGRCGLDVAECTAFVDASAMMRDYRSRLFTRIVPTLKDIGLWGPRLRKALTDLDVMKLADVDLDALGRHDDDVAVEFDRLRAARDLVARPAVAVG